MGKLDKNTNGDNQDAKKTRPNGLLQVHKRALGPPQESRSPLLTPFPQVVLLMPLGAL